MKKKCIAFIVVLIFVFINTFSMLSVSAASYDVEAAINYAQNHWNDGQGQCAEFVSRCVMAGGLINKVYTVTGGIRGTYGCFNAVCDASGLSMIDLTLDANGNARYSDNCNILSRGDVVVQWCYTHAISPHIMICGGYNSDGIATFYAHNGAKNNETYNWRYNTSYQHTTSCNMGAKVIHISSLSGSTYTPPAPQKQEPYINISTDSVNFDPDNLTRTIDVSLGGDLPEQYTISVGCDESIAGFWGDWSGSNISLTLKSNGKKLTNSVGELKLLDSGGNVLITKSFTINVEAKAYAIISFSEASMVLKRNTRKSSSVDVRVYGSNLDEHASIACEVPDGLSYSWERISDGYRLTISLNGEAPNTNVITVKVLDNNKNEYTSQALTVYVWDDEPIIKFENDELYLLQNEYQPIYYSIENLDDSYTVNIECDKAYAWRQRESDKDNVIYIRATENSPEEGELTINVKNNDGKIIATKSMELFFVGKAKSDDDIPIFINNRCLTFDVKPRMINNRTMIPIRKISEIIGADVSWDSKNKTAELRFADDIVKIKVGESYIEKNGKKIYIDSPAVVIDGRTLVPIRAIAESFGCNVEWNEKYKEVIIEVE